MLTAIPRSVFSWRYTIFDGRTKITEIQPRRFGERGRFQLADREFEVQRKSFWNGEFSLRCDARTLATAKKMSVFRRSFELRVGGRRSYTLRAIGTLTRKFELCEGRRRLGVIRPQGAFTRKTDIDLPDDMELSIRIFVFWLVLTLWRRAAAAAGGA